jgi:hypothetical protein
LFPPGSASLDRIDAVHKCMSKDCVSSWKRPDVLGLIMASYAMLLWSSPLAASSPRVNAAAAGGVIDIRRLFREFIEASVDLKSFTFARLCLVPGLCMPPSIAHDYVNVATAPTCDVQEFFLSVVAEFASHYLDILSVSGDHPISRAKWEQDAEESLQLRQAHQEQQQSFRGQFPTWSDAANVTDTGYEVPSQVDLLTRPDCLDDVIAFSSSVGFLGPDYALLFWSQVPVWNGTEKEPSDEKSMKLVPSRALLWLGNQQRDDDSLRPLYLSFLAALALAKNPSNSANGCGADVVHDIISESGDAGSGWSSLIEVLRWYIRQLSPDISTSKAPAVSAAVSGGSTAYYYSDEDVRGSESGVGSNDRSKVGDSVSQSRPRELGATNEFIVLSHLVVIANVASNSADARSAITFVSLPIIESDGESVGQESVLVVLFTLAVMPLSPEIRGSVFRAIAMLLSVAGCSAEETAKMRNVAANAWELVESCQIVPIGTLEQYHSTQDLSLLGAPKMLFPPSSSALVRFG